MMEREPSKPRVDLGLLENISNVSWLNVRTYKTNDSLKDLLTDGYWKRASGMLKHDRIIVAASADTSTPENCTLVVTDSNPAGGATVGVLREAGGK